MKLALSEYVLIDSPHGRRLPALARAWSREVPDSEQGTLLHCSPSSSAHG